MTIKAFPYDSTFVFDMSPAGHNAPSILPELVKTGQADGASMRLPFILDRDLQSQDGGVVDWRLRTDIFGDRFQAYTQQFLARTFP